MTIHPLVEEEAAYSGATHRGIITFADLVATAGAGAQAFNLAPVIAGVGVALEYAKLVTPFVFSDATLISNGVTAGDTGSANRYLTTLETAAVVPTAITVKGGVALNPVLYIYAAADNFIVTMTPTGGKSLNTATAGEIHFLLTMRNTVQV